LDKEDDTPLKKVSAKEIEEVQKAETAKKKLKEKTKAKKLHSLGFEAENELIL
jgi:hypothetical protein